MHKHSSQNSLQKRSKMVLNIPKEVNDVDKVEEEEERENLEEKAMIALVG